MTISKQEARKVQVETLLNLGESKLNGYYNILAKMTGSCTSGVLLSYFIYWDGVHQGKEFVKTDNELYDDLGFSVYELTKTKKRLVKLDVIDIDRRGFGLEGRTYYKLKLDNVMRLKTKLLLSAIDNKV